MKELVPHEVATRMMLAVGWNPEDFKVRDKITSAIADECEWRNKKAKERSERGDTKRMLYKDEIYDVRLISSSPRSITVENPFKGSGDRYLGEGTFIFSRQETLTFTRRTNGNYVLKGLGRNRMILILGLCA